MPIKRSDWRSPSIHRKRLGAGRRSTLCRHTDRASLGSAGHSRGDLRVGVLHELSGHIVAQADSRGLGKPAPLIVTCVPTGRSAH